MSEFAIGQKIVCVRDDWKNSVFGSSVRETGERHPVKDGVYTVIGHDWLLLADRPGVIIAEVNNDCIWAEQNFRPIEPKTDISVFQKLLVNPKQKIDAKNGVGQRRRSAPELGFPRSPKTNALRPAMHHRFAGLVRFLTAFYCRSRRRRARSK